ncbi:unnamed protein product, partial [Cyprideis torosa]
LVSLQAEFATIPTGETGTFWLLIGSVTFLRACSEIHWGLEVPEDIGQALLLPAPDAFNRKESLIISIRETASRRLPSLEEHLLRLSSFSGDVDYVFSSISTFLGMVSRATRGLNYDLTSLDPDYSPPKYGIFIARTASTPFAAQRSIVTGHMVKFASFRNNSVTFFSHVASTELRQLREMAAGARPPTSFCLESSLSEEPPLDSQGDQDSRGLRLRFLEPWVSVTLTATITGSIMSWAFLAVLFYYTCCSQTTRVHPSRRNFCFTLSLCSITLLILASVAVFFFRTSPLACALQRTVPPLSLSLALSAVLGRSLMMSTLLLRTPPISRLLIGFLQTVVSSLCFAVQLGISMVSIAYEVRDIWSQGTTQARALDCAQRTSKDIVRQFSYCLLLLAATVIASLRSSTNKKNGREGLWILLASISLLLSWTAVLTSAALAREWYEVCICIGVVTTAFILLLLLCVPNLCLYSTMSGFLLFQSRSNPQQPPSSVNGNQMSGDNISVDKSSMVERYSLTGDPTDASFNILGIPDMSDHHNRPQRSMSPNLYSISTSTNPIPTNPLPHHADSSNVSDYYRDRFLEDFYARKLKLGNSPGTMSRVTNEGIY